nr:hypothetical protein [Nostoc sp. CmiVER01]MDZ8124227.1 hypothetical protein [Nostoc sp. CmiVER01]
MSRQKKPIGCGCANIPFSVIIVILGGGYWWFSQKENLDISKLLPKNQQINIPILNPSPTASSTPTVSLSSIPNPILNNNQASVKTIQNQKASLPPTLWEKKVIRGIYLTRYQITNNADEQTISERVRYYHSQGINTIIYGVWGNGCTMYNSEVMQQTLGYKSC